MNTGSSDLSPAYPPKLISSILMRFLQVAILIAVQAAILFITAGSFNWVWAWVFLGIYLLSVSINSAFLLPSTPETVAERGRAQEMKDWDKLVSGLWSLAQFLILPIVAGLDFQFHWTKNFDFFWHMAGAVLFTLGLGLFGWALITNTYFSTVARIQHDRGQTVCSTGPYHYVRHPGYAGAILQSIGIALLLGSWWSLIPGFVAVLLMILRTSLEDHLLQAELIGYEEYACRVRYRLIPGFW